MVFTVFVFPAFSRYIKPSPYPTSRSRTSDDSVHHSLRLAPLFVDSCNFLSGSVPVPDNTKARSGEIGKSKKVNMHLSTIFAALLVSTGSLASAAAIATSNGGQPAPNPAEPELDVAAARVETRSELQLCCNWMCRTCSSAAGCTGKPCMDWFVSAPSVIFRDTNIPFRILDDRVLTR